MADQHHGFEAELGGDVHPDDHEPDEGLNIFQLDDKHSQRLPAKLFELEDLLSVLSLETWNECLREDEKKALISLLPSELDSEQLSRTLRELLTGGNFYFGNPIQLTWEKLRSGFFHPKVGNYRAAQLFLEKRAYYHDLRDYHNGMIGRLLDMRKAWRHLPADATMKDRLSVWEEACGSVRAQPPDEGGTEPAGNAGFMSKGGGCDAPSSQDKEEENAGVSLVDEGPTFVSSIPGGWELFQREQQSLASQVPSPDNAGTSHPAFKYAAFPGQKLWEVPAEGASKDAAPRPSGTRGVSPCLVHMTCWIQPAAPLFSAIRHALLHGNTTPARPLLTRQLIDRLAMEPALTLCLQPAPGHGGSDSDGPLPLPLPSLVEAALAFMSEPMVVSGPAPPPPPTAGEADAPPPPPPPRDPTLATVPPMVMRRGASDTRDREHSPSGTPKQPVGAADVDNGPAGDEDLSHAQGKDGSGEEGWVWAAGSKSALPVHTLAAVETLFLSSHGIINALADAPVGSAASGQRAGGSSRWHAGADGCEGGSRHPSGLPPYALWFTLQESERYSRPEAAYFYTTLSGGCATVAPIRRLGVKPTAKARDHSVLMSDRPPHVTILSLVRDAAARLPGGIGTRLDVCALLRNSQFLVESVSGFQVNQVVSGALDRLHYERDPCVRFDQDMKLWVYLHGDRGPGQFSHQCNVSTKKSRRGSMALPLGLGIKKEASLTGDDMAGGRMADGGSSPEAEPASPLGGGMDPRMMHDDPRHVARLYGADGQHGGAGSRKRREVHDEYEEEDRGEDEEEEQEEEEEEEEDTGGPAYEPRGELDETEMMHGAPGGSMMEMHQPMHHVRHHRGDGRREMAYARGGDEEGHHAMEEARVTDGRIGGHDKAEAARRAKLKYRLKQKEKKALERQQEGQQRRGGAGPRGVGDRLGDRLGGGEPDNFYDRQMERSQGLDMGATDVRYPVSNRALLHAHWQPT